MIKYVVFRDVDGVETKRGVCQPELLQAFAEEGEAAYPLSPEEEALGLTLQQLPTGEIVPYEA